MKDEEDEGDEGDEGTRGTKMTVTRSGEKKKGCRTDNLYGSEREI
jgi:hypothetical protein